MNCNYLAFEGIDGSGKTTLINELSAELSKASIDFKIVREPGGTKLSEGIRDLLLSHDSRLIQQRKHFFLVQAVPN